MSDLPGLPPRRTPPSMDPPAGSADRAVHRGDARRRRVAVSAASTFGLAALATAAVLQAPEGPRSRLDAANQPLPTVGVSGTVAPPAMPTVVPEPTATVTGPAASGTVGPTGSVPSASASTAPDPRPQPSPSATVSQPSEKSGMRREETAYAVGSCQDRASSRTARGWCLSYVGARSGKAGAPTTLAVELCRLPGFGTGTASFYSSQEADFSVSTGGSTSREAWRWSRGRAFADSAHALRITESRCARWSTVWSVTGNDGRPLARGTYDLLPEVTAHDLGDDYLKETFAFTVS